MKRRKIVLLKKLTLEDIQVDCNICLKVTLVIKTLSKRKLFLEYFQELNNDHVKSAKKYSFLKAKIPFVRIVG